MDHGPGGRSGGGEGFGRDMDDEPTQVNAGMPERHHDPHNGPHNDPHNVAPYGGQHGFAGGPPADDATPTIADAGQAPHDAYRPPLPENLPAAGVPNYAPPPDPYLEKTIAGRYYVTRKLGEGGMGAVYLATHITLEKEVALKILHAELSRKRDLVERFLQEAKAASRIRHENVIDITDFGATQDGAVFFAMEVLDGRDLHDLIARTRYEQRALPWKRARPIFTQICRALATAHERGVIHRDLKPENIYLIERMGNPDFVKLLDFGIAKFTEMAEGDRKLTKTGMLFGTPEYMSPEQARGDKVDHRVDIYAMGCLLYQLITGEVPFKADNFMGVLSRHMGDDPPIIPHERLRECGAPLAINDVIQRALAKDRNDRHATMEELLADLEQVERGQPGMVPFAPGGAPSASALSPASAPPARRAPTPPPPSPTQAAPLATEVSPFHGLDTPPAAPAAPAAASSQHRILTDTSDATPDEPSRSRSVLWAVLAVLVIGGGVGVGVAFYQKSQAEGTAALSEDLAPETGALAEERVSVELTSQPSGARVYDESGRELGVTPFTHELPASDQTHRYRLALDGYREQWVDVVADRARSFDRVLEADASIADAGPDAAMDAAIDAAIDDDADDRRRSDDRKRSDERRRRKKSDKDDGKDDGGDTDDPTDDPKIKNPFGKRGAK